MSEEDRSTQETRIGRTRQRNQGIYWLLTIPNDPVWTPPLMLPSGIVFVKGQLERGGSSGYEHWQVIAAFESKKSLLGVKRCIIIN